MNYTTTTNGAITNETSTNQCLDLFQRIGNMRYHDRLRILEDFNKAYNEGKIETLGFRLASNKVTLEDSDGSLHSIYTTTAGSVLSANLVGGSLIQSNLANIVSSDSSTGKSPILRFTLDSIPAANKSE